MMAVRWAAFFVGWP